MFFFVVTHSKNFHSFWNYFQFYKFVFQSISLANEGHVFSTLLNNNVTGSICKVYFLKKEARNFRYSKNIFDSRRSDSLQHAIRTILRGRPRKFPTRLLSSVQWSQVCVWFDIRLPKLIDALYFQSIFSLQSNRLYKSLAVQFPWGNGAVRIGCVPLLVIRRKLLARFWRYF